MGDVAQILGSAQAKVGGTQMPLPPPPPASHIPPKAIKMAGVSREVMDLLAGGNQDPKSATLPPIVPKFNKETDVSSAGGLVVQADNKDHSVKVGGKWISSSKRARKWTWAPFASSSRTDGAMYRHWVRANVEYTDYPYAKFDIHLDPVTYTEAEYARYLKSDTWTKSETDKLLEMARKYELRWAVIHDRWFGYYHIQQDNSPADRKVEELMHRYYSVAAILAQTRISQEAAAEVQALSSAPDPVGEDEKEATENLLMETAAARALATAPPRHQPLINNIGTGSSNKTFDIIYERERRAHMDRLWKRSKEEEAEEMNLRKELRLIDAQLRKLKKTGGHILAAANSNASVAGTTPKIAASAASSRNPSRSVSPVPGANIAESPDILDQCFASTAPTPMPKTPYLQSGRLLPPATGGAVGLNKSLLNRMDAVLAELKIPPRPIPTKRVCDLYDSVRKDILMLLTLQKMLLQKEGNLQAKRLRLSKLVGGSDRFLDEEGLLGISTPPAPASGNNTTAAASANRVKPATKPKSKPAATGTTTKKSTSPKAKADDATGKPESNDAAAAANVPNKKPKSSVKRKRKPDATKSPAPTPSSSSGIPGAPPVAAPPPLQPAAAPPVTKPAPVDTGESKQQQGGKKRARKS